MVKFFIPVDCQITPRTRAVFFCNTCGKDHEYKISTITRSERSLGIDIFPSNTKIKCPLQQLSFVCLITDND